MFYEKLAQAKEDKKRGERNRLDDLGFNVGAGMLAHKGLERGLDASAFSRDNMDGRIARKQYNDIISASSGKYSKEQLREARKQLRATDFSNVSATTTHNPLTRLVDKMSGATGLRDEYRKHRDQAEDFWEQQKAIPWVKDGDNEQIKQLKRQWSEQVDLRDAAQEKMRGRRLLGRRVAHGVGLGATLLGANKLRNMYNARKERKKSGAI